MTQLRGPIQLKGGTLAARPATGVDRQPYFARDNSKLYVWDAIGTAWKLVGGSTVLFETNGVPNGSQAILNLQSGGGLLTLTDDGLGNITFDDSATVNAINVESARAVAAEGTKVPNTRTVTATLPITGGGALSADIGIGINNFSGDFGVGGLKGAVPAPGSGDAVNKKYLFSNGSWKQVAYADVSGTPTLAATLANVSHKWLNSYNAATGLFTQTQPDYTDLTGTPQLAVTKAAASTKFLTAYDASTGLFTNGQPAFSDLSGSIALSQTALSAVGDMGYVGAGPALARLAGNITATKQFLNQTGNGSISAAPTWSALVAADIPSLAASIITSGLLALARGGTNADLSGTGGASQVLKQTSVGGAISVAQLAFSDLSGSIAAGQIASGTVLWNTLGNASGALTLANGTNNTTFNQTSAATWTWANTTAATAGGVVSASPVNAFGYRVFTGGADTGATWKVQATLNPTTALFFTITNAVENGSNDVTFTIGTHTLVIGNVVTFSGLTGTYTWMNGQTCYVEAIAATTITVRDATAHGVTGGSNPGGTCTQQPVSQLVFSTTGIPTATDSITHTAAEQRLIFPLCGGFANSSSGMGSFAFAGQSDFAGYGPTGASGGLSIYYSTGASSAQWLTLYQRSSAGSNHIPNALGALSFGDNSPGNSTIWLSAIATNYSVSIVGGNTTNTTCPAVHLGNIGNLTAASGNQIGIGMGVPNGQGSPILNFSPASGTATFSAAELRYTINQTGGANGAITGLKITASETAVGGAHKVIDIFTGSAAANEIFSLAADGTETTYTPNGAQWVYGSASELLTLSTIGLTTDTTANLLPANAVIEAVVCRVTTTITTTTNWAVGDGTTSARFASANATLTAGTTTVGLNHWSGAVTTLAAGPSQAAAAKVRITCTGTNPGAGVIRITVFYRTFVAPTS